MPTPDVPTIFAACETNHTKAFDAFLAEILVAWPGGVVPHFKRTRLDELHVRARTLREDDNSVVLAFTPKTYSANSMDQLHDTFHEQSLPAIIMCENADTWRALQHDGVIFEEHTTPAYIVAAMLYALGERQGMVRVLSREITLAQRCQAGFRVEMERLHDELHLAASIQREFAYAPFPKVDGLDLAVVFKPMSFVSGDIYAVERIGTHHAFIFLADVVGHGVPAALLTMVLRNCLITAREGVPIPPSEVLSRLNERMCESQQGSGRFATALYALFDLRTRRLTLAGAGHPAPILLKATGRQALETQGPLLGVFAESQFDEVEVDFSITDTLLMYTDGLDLALEALAKEVGTRHSIDTVATLVERANIGENASASCLVREISALIDEQCGSLHQLDDITILAIRGVASTAASTIEASPNADAHMPRSLPSTNAA